MGSTHLAVLVSSKASMIAAACRAPVNSGIPVVGDRPARTGKLAVAKPPVLTMPIRTGEAGGQAALDRERADPGEQVPAVLPVGNRGLVDTDLQEQVVDVRIGPGRSGRSPPPWRSAGALRRSRRSAWRPGSP